MNTKNPNPNQTPKSRDFDIQILIPKTQYGDFHSNGRKIHIPKKNINS